MIPSENISKEDSLVANVVLKISTACPNEGSQQSKFLASTKDTIPQEAPNALDVKEKGKIKESEFNLEEGSETPFKDVSEIDPIKKPLPSGRLTCKNGGSGKSSDAHGLWGQNPKC